MDGPSLQRGGGGRYARFRVIRMIEGFWGFEIFNFEIFLFRGGGGKLNSIKQLYAGDLCCATYPGLVYWMHILVYNGLQSVSGCTQ